MNSYALPVIKYPAEIINWPKDKVQTTDVTTHEGSLPFMEGSVPPQIYHPGIIH